MRTERTHWARRLSRRGLVAATILSATTPQWLAACAAPGVAPPAGGAAGPARIGVAYWTTTPEQTELRARVVQQFRARYPLVEVEEITVAGAAGLNEKVLALVAAGTPPDVMNLGFGGAGGAADLAARGALLKLNDRIKRDGALRWDDFWPGARLNGQFEDAQVALPNYGINAALLYFNRQLFAVAGRPLPDELFQRGQLRWDTLVEEATRLTKREPAGELVQAGLGYPWEPISWTLILLRSYGADYLSQEGTRVVLDSPQAVQALRVAYELGPRRSAMPRRADGEHVELVKAGRVAQSIYWMGAASWWRATSFDWDVAPTPAGPAGRATYGKPFHLTLARETPAPDAAWAYAVFAVSPEVDAEQAASWGYMTLRQSSIPAWRKQMGDQKPRNLNLVEETARALKLEPLLRPHPQLPEVDKIFQRELAALFEGAKPPEQVVSAVATEGNALLGRS